MFDIMVGMINMTVLVALICIGVIIKQSPVFDKVANEYIPLILFICGVVFMFIYKGVSFDNAVNGMVTAFVATGMYEHARSVILKGIIDKLFPNIEEEE